jgi:hypothetical protein
MNTLGPGPDPHLVQALAILDVLEAALFAAMQSVSAEHPAAILQDGLLADPTVQQETAWLVCSAAQTLTAALRDYRLNLLGAFEF